MSLFDIANAALRRAALSRRSNLAAKSAKAEMTLRQKCLNKPTRELSGLFEAASQDGDFPFSATAIMLGKVDSPIPSSFIQKCKKLASVGARPDKAFFWDGGKGMGRATTPLHCLCLGGHLDLFEVFEHTLRPRTPHPYDYCGRTPIDCSLESFIPRANPFSGDLISGLPLGFAQELYKRRMEIFSRLIEQSTVWPIQPSGTSHAFGLAGPGPSQWYADSMPCAMRAFIHGAPQEASATAANKLPPLSGIQCKIANWSYHAELSCCAMGAHSAILPRRAELSARFLCAQALSSEEWSLAEHQALSYARLLDKTHHEQRQAALAESFSLPEYSNIKRAHCERLTLDAATSHGTSRRRSASL